MPVQIMDDPARFGLADWRIHVHMELIQALRTRLIPREEALRWVPVDFDNIAYQVHTQIGSPSLTNADTAWNIFSRMSPVVQDMYGDR